MSPISASSSRKLFMKKKKTEVQSSTVGENVLKTLRAANLRAI
jgi:transcriptional regulator NrdR family protein